MLHLQTGGIVKPTTLSPDDLLDPAGAGKYLGGRGAPVSIPTLARWRSEGYGPRFHRVGLRRIRYRVRDLDAWIESMAVDPTAA